jgi:predicted amidophosphoribosyltransferase
MAAGDELRLGHGKGAAQVAPARRGVQALLGRGVLRAQHEILAHLDAQLVTGRHVALVDDVLTTGATAEALARLLRRAGAARVDVYCLARTPAPD